MVRAAQPRARSATSVATRRGEAQRLGGIQPCARRRMRGLADLLPRLRDESEPSGITAVDLECGEAAEHVAGEQVLPARGPGRWPAGSRRARCRCRTCRRAARRRIRLPRWPLRRVRDEWRAGRESSDSPSPRARRRLARVRERTLWIKPALGASDRHQGRSRGSSTTARAGRGTSASAMALPKSRRFVGSSPPGSPNRAGEQEPRLCVIFPGPGRRSVPAACAARSTPSSGSSPPQKQAASASSRALAGSPPAAPRSRSWQARRRQLERTRTLAAMSSAWSMK